MVNNFELLSSLIEDGLVYHVQIINRSHNKGDNRHRTVCTFLPKSKSELWEIKDSVEAICQKPGYRAYINVCGKQDRLLIFKIIEILFDQIRTNLFSFRSAIQSALGNVKSDNQYWIVDIDTTELDEIEEVVNAVNSVRGSDNRIVMTVPTIKGVHLLTRPFDLQEFKKICPGINVHKNNPTLLFAYS